MPERTGDRALAHDFLDSPDAFAAFVDAWRRGTLARERWTHAAHVAVAAGYAFSLRGEALCDAMRDGIMTFNRCVGAANTETSGYHETLTRFWCGTIERLIADRGLASAHDAAVAAVAEFGESRDLFRKYYDFDVVGDRTARRTWVPPATTPR